MKILKKQTERLKVDWVVRFKRKMCKVIAEDDDTYFLIPFDKGIKYKSVVQRTEYYEDNVIEAEKGTKFNVYGKHKDNIDKMLESKSQEEVEEVTRKTEKKSVLEKANISKEVRDIIREEMRSIAHDASLDVQEKISKELNRLKENGRYYRGEFKETTASKIAITTLKKMGKEGWRYCFEHEDKIYFQREKR